MNQYDGEFPSTFPEGHKNLEIIELLGDNFIIAWGGIRIKSYSPQSLLYYRK